MNRKSRKIRHKKIHLMTVVEARRILNHLWCRGKQGSTYAKNLENHIKYLYR